MKFKQGDYVKIIRKFDESAEYYQCYPGVNKPMKQMVGKIFKISRTDGHSYIIDGWWFVDEMIECRVIKIGDSYIPFSENMEVEE